MDLNLDEYKLSAAVIKKREELHMTQEAFVRYIGEDKVSLSTLKRIERRIKISPSKALIVLTALNMNINDYLE